jgi:3-hydroxy-9,10-secoandrosta-1,3,5(10)-triene-9,17-dione monooxygenase reductase component
MPCGPTDGVAREQQEFRTVLGHFATGVAVAAAVCEGRPAGLTVQSFCSLSLEPPLILLCASLSSTSWPRIEAGGKLCVNLLAEDQVAIARQLAQSGGEKFGALPWSPAPFTGSPVLGGVLAWVDCQIHAIHPGGDHKVAVCRVLGLGARTDRRPLIYYRSGFERML